MPVLVSMMLFVVIGFSALALTSAEAVRAARPRTRTAVTGIWLIFILAGWLATAWIVTQTPGGASGVWAWEQAQPLLARAAMWLLLLPWTTAVWILQSGWPVWVRIVAVAALALTVIGLNVGQVAEALRHADDHVAALVPDINVPVSVDDVVESVGAIDDGPDGTPRR